MVNRQHARNPQGTGQQLRDDILAAAGRILEKTGSDDAVTLRAIAREAGITAPAIYAHFSDRDAIRTTVISDTFAQLAEKLTSVYDAVAAAGADPVERLHAVCHAYMHFAADRPHHYRVLFERHRVRKGGELDSPVSDTQSIVGAEAFNVLVRAIADCIPDGSTSVGDPVASATRVWIGLHGHATLKASLPWFPWPDTSQLTDELVRHLAELEATR